MKYYCYDQYKTLHIRGGLPGHVNISPCCASVTEETPSSPFDFSTVRPLQNIRESSALGIPPLACSYCWNNEKTDGTSRRLHVNDFQNRISNNSNSIFDTTIELKQLDITTQNICNLACIQCGSGSSSTWAEQLGLPKVISSYDDKIAVFKQIDHSKLVKLHFTGGEPLMTSEHQKILEILASENNLQKINLSYNTNGTFFPDQDVIDLWHQTNKCNIAISIDAIGPAAEFIRWPCIWSQVYNTIDKFVSLSKNSTKININLVCCVSNYNILELVDIKKLSDHFGIDIQLQVNNMPCFYPEILPRQLLDGATDALLPYSMFDQLVQRITAPQSATVRRTQGSYLLRDAITYLDQLDAKRNTDWRTALKFGNFFPK